MAWNNPFFDSASKYGSPTGQDWSETPFVKQFLDPQIPQGVFGNFLNDQRQGFSGMGRQGDFGRGLYGQTQTGYQAALRTYPGLTYEEYLRMQFKGANSINNLWDQATARQRGEQSSLWTGPGRIIRKG